MDLRANWLSLNEKLDRGRVVQRDSSLPGGDIDMGYSVLEDPPEALVFVV